MTTNFDLLTIGNAKMDAFVILDKLKGFSYDKFTNQITFPLGNKIPLNEFKFLLGGNAANVAVGVSRLGYKSSIATVIGNDEFSKQVITILTNNGVDTSNVIKVNDDDPNFNIILSYEGERTVLEEKSNLEGEFNLDDINPSIIYLTSIHGEWIKIYEYIFNKFPVAEYFYNPSNRQINNDLNKIYEFLPKIKYLFVNLQEAQQISNEENPDIEKLLKKLQSLGPKNIIITDGINGSYSINEMGEIYHMTPASNDMPIEKTGAGDSYAAGFIYGILKGHNLGDAMRYGALNSENVIKKIGAQEGLLTSNEIEEESKSNTNLTAIKI